MTPTYTPTTRYDNAPIPEVRLTTTHTSRAMRRASWRRTFRGRPFQGPAVRDGYPWALPCGDIDIAALEALRKSIQAKLDKDGRFKAA